MLPFQEQIVSDLLEDPNGGLVVLSSGLALPSLIATLLHLHHPSPQTLLILSATDSQKSSITRAISSPQNPNPNPNPNPTPPPSDIPGDLPPPQRTALYSTGSAFFVTPRILIADLLTSRVPPSALAGLLILNAHRLSDTSTESFIARILISLSRSAYIRAFSDRPNAMVAGFSKAERIMKALYIRRMHLWPRFHLQVSADLERDPPEVVDIRVPMTAAMRGIQTAVLDAMGACLKELQSTNKVDVDDLTVENGLFKSFDEIVRRQLDPIWHTIGKKTKQLVSDLRTLRILLDYLVRYDAVTYLRYLDTLRVSEGVRSVWILADSSHKIFELAKRRVYQVVRADGVRMNTERKSPANKRKRSVKDTSKKRKESEHEAPVSNDTNADVVLVEVLEEAPKWKVLHELLEEIEEERRKEPLPTEGQVLCEDVGDDSGIVLVVCKDEHSCLQLEDCLTKGPHQVMKEEWGKYLLGKAELHGLQKHKKKRSQEPRGFGILDGEVPSVSSENTKPRSITKLENDALLAAASEISYPAKEEIVVGDNARTRRGRGRGIKLKDKVNSKKAKAKIQVFGNKSKKQAENSRIEATISESKAQGGESEGIDAGDANDSSHNTQKGISADKGVFEKQTDGQGTEELRKSLPPVQFYALDSDQHILDVWKPSVIIVYHPEITFVREIEIYRAQNPLKKLKVHFLFYEESAEVQKFEASIRRENGSFESLIRQKSLMMIPVDQDGRCIGSIASGEPQSPLLQNSLTRKAGGRKTVEKVMQVIVDIREFMSSLPNVLHQKGMKVIPVTLEVGDYVLSPLICVERKSITDLFQSFASGRLYNQVETMSRYYKMPVLLIEFSQDKSFSFQSASDIGNDVSSTSIISKLSLLVLHFPRLRLVWSRSVHATAEIFASFKANQDEPDESKATRVGVPSEDGIIEDDIRAENYNTSAIEFLRRLPGVTESNYRALMDGCQNLAELALLPVERLAELMGGQKAARTLKEFLDAKCPSMF